MLIISVKEEITQSYSKLPSVNLIYIFPFSLVVLICIRTPYWCISVNIKIYIFPNSFGVPSRVALHSCMYYVYCTACPRFINSRPVRGKSVKRFLSYDRNSNKTDKQRLLLNRFFILISQQTFSKLCWDVLGA